MKKVNGIEKKSQIANMLVGEGVFVDFRGEIYI